MKSKRVTFEKVKSTYPRLKLREPNGKHEIFFEYALSTHKQMNSDDFQQFLDEFQPNRTLSAQMHQREVFTKDDRRVSILDSSLATDLNISSSLRDSGRNYTVEDLSFLVRKGKENT